jgi:hypothetical protein
MIVSALKSQLETFRSEAIKYRDLYAESLEGPMPEDPTRTRAALGKLSDTLLRQLGLLRPYLEALNAAWTLGVYGRS